ncbi:MAG TPA: hypothetical protein VNZ03_35495 [Terriglobales bacterium]|nr:hypothetical protein [Terriglobales bacterium]
MLGASNARGPPAVYHDPDLADVLACNFQGIEQCRAGDNGCAMLVIMKDWDLHRLLQALFDIEALRRLDVLQVDSAEGGFEQLADLDNLVRIVSVDFKVEDIHAGESFEENSFPFHVRFSREGSDAAQTENGSPYF